MDSRLFRRQDRIWLSLTILAVMMLHGFAFGRTLVADDIWFAQALQHRTLLEFLAWRYVEWSGRLPLEAALVAVVNHPWAWKFINGSMLLLLCYSAGRIALGATERSAASATALAFGVLMLVAPPVLYTAAWWITGSVNYLWPVALGFYGMLPLVGTDRHANASRFVFLLCSGLAMYNEQVALVLLPAALICLGTRVAKAEWRWWDVAQVVFMAFNAAVLLAAPGSYRRYLSEQALRFPDFATLDVIDKLAIGFGLVFRGVINPHNLLVALLVVLCGALLLRAPLGRVAKLVLWIALAFLALGYLSLLPGLDSAGMIRFYVLPPLDGAAASSLRIYVASAWSAFVVACLVAAATASAGRSLGEYFAILVTLLLGLASLGAMGFSPTAYASGDRIHFVCQMAFLLVALRLMALAERTYGPCAMNAGIVFIVLAAGYRIVQLLPL